MNFQVDQWPKTPFLTFCVPGVLMPTRRTVPKRDWVRVKHVINLIGNYM